MRRKNRDRKRKREWRSFFCFEFFAIDFALNWFHVNEIENLWSVVSIIEKVRKHQKVASRKKRKERMSFEIFNQYRKNRSISNESDASLIEEIFAKRKLFESTSHEKEAAFVAKKIEQFKSSTTISFLQTLQMLSRWLIIMSALETFKTLLFDEYNITKFRYRYVDLCQNYNLEKKEKIRRLFRYCDFMSRDVIIHSIKNAKVVC